MRRAEKNATTRRLGPVGSENWHAMLDAAEEALLEKGVAALTAARVSERLGIKRRLVYYYFQTLDDLIVETFRRISVRELARIADAAASDKPLREIWDACIHTMHPRLITEFMALAHHIDGLRKEVTHFIEESRRLQIQTLSAAIARVPGLTGADPEVLAVLATSTALSLLRERELGVTEGHDEVLLLIENFLAAAEPQLAEQGQVVRT
ncbi:TetR/AcrR family transcriptional regulator [Novosphingobium sp. TH158]|uniref:TetR/AcrR family transcriptional regulator n=1 Tax=Novosphingobium sp. TH158 TaxID=2067455 RepID=UPI000C7A4EC5|nr:TetR/AcrR family transcriptional regulator [Novosphingobium sp. TH158]PLK26727.1 TetR/AcrR family transcriptional regulator [Novosphingobium sp. TH158]